MQHTPVLRSVLVGCAAAALATLAAAEPPRTGAAQRSVIGAGALGDTRGAVNVNVTAGRANVQANAGAIALHGGDGRVGVGQRTAAGASSERARARIGAGAFRRARGWIAVNQSAGGGNAQSNAMVIEIGIDGAALEDGELATVGTAQRNGPASPGTDDERSLEARIEPGAFRGAQGIVQVNQAAGSGNATTNRFGLSVQRATDP